MTNFFFENHKICTKNDFLIFHWSKVKYFFKLKKMLDIQKEIQRREEFLAQHRRNNSEVYEVEREIKRCFSKVIHLADEYNEEWNKLNKLVDRTIDESHTRDDVPIDNNFIPTHAKFVFGILNEEISNAENATEFLKQIHEWIVDSLERKNILLDSIKRNKIKGYILNKSREHEFGQFSYYGLSHPGARDRIKSLKKLFPELSVEITWEKYDKLTRTKF